MAVWRLILVPHLIALVLSVPSHSREKFYRVTQVAGGDVFPFTMAKGWDWSGLIHEKSMNPKNCIKMSKEWGRISSLAGLQGRRHGRSWGQNGSNKKD
jgi:hypothetical protein